MLTRFIVHLYSWIIEVYLWLLLLVSGVYGYQEIVPALKFAGWELENEAVWNICGALVCVTITFLVSAVVAGPILVLIEIRKSVRAIEMREDGSEVLPVERKEPSL